MFDAADVVVSHSYVEPRIAPGMLESRGILVVPEGDRLVVYCSHQAPHRLRDDLSRCLSMDLDKVRVVTPEVGGAFGAKGTFYPEYLLAAHAARTLGRPVKYVETRSENLMVATHGRAQRQSVGLGARADGTLVGMRFRTIADFGAAADNQRWCLLLTEMMLSGCYRIPTIEAELLGVLTNTAPVGAFRGAGKPEATYAIERTMDHLARRLGIDPAELRRRNFIAPEEFPYDTGGRAVYDSGAYRTALDLALDRAGYAEVRRLQVERRGSGGPLIGVGIASYVEAAGRGEEYGNVTLNRDGSVTALTGVSPHGQGHETAWAQVVADQLTVRADRVVVVHGDTGQVPRGEGTGSSRSAAVGAGAVGVAARRVAERLRLLAAELLEAAPEDIRLAGGRAEVVGTDVGIDVSELAAAAGGVSEETVLSPPGPTFPFGCHVCRVEIDPDTGVVAVVGYVAVDDCGTVINPMLTEGQILGGVVQGISHALREEVRFDEAGNPLTANWATYLMPAAADVPPLMTGRTETPSPINPMGVKGVGEAGAIGSTPAVANAVFDALAPRGVSDEALPMPFTPTRVWTALRGVAP